MEIGIYHMGTGYPGGLKKYFFHEVNIGKDGSRTIVKFDCHLPSEGNIAGITERRGIHGNQFP